MDCSTDQELRTLIEAGCDERLFLNAKTGLNKYHLDPMLYTGSHYRGSCTCGSLTPFTWPIAVKAAERIRQSGLREFNQWAEEQRNRNKHIFEPLFRTTQPNYVEQHSHHPRLRIGSRATIRDFPQLRRLMRDKRLLI